jgi:hypothetical protein
MRGTGLSKGDTKANKKTDYTNYNNSNHHYDENNNPKETYNGISPQVR